MSMNLIWSKCFHSPLSSTTIISTFTIATFPTFKLYTYTCSCVSNVSYDRTFEKVETENCNK